jgi:hypothetical protein
MGTLELFAKQIITLSWLRCAVEEGTTFINKQTGEAEENELIIYSNINSGSGLFDLPDVACTPRGLEKNLYEVLGSFVVQNKNPDVLALIISPEFIAIMEEHIKDIKARKFSGKRRKSK